MRSVTLSMFFVLDNDSLSDHPYYKFQSLQHPELKDGKVRATKLLHYFINLAATFPTGTLGSCVSLRPVCQELFN